MRALSITRSTVLRTLICVACVLINPVVSQISRASVFSNSVFLFPGSFPPPGQPGFEMQAWTQPNGTGNGGFVEVTINPSLVLSPYAYTVGIGERWFSANYGDVFDTAALSTATPFANNLAAPFTPGQIQLSVGQDFYLAFWLQSSPPPYAFGWAHLKLTSTTTLTLLGNAIEDSGSGIIVGTTTVVPEPSSFYLAAMAFVLLATLLRRRS
jgi:hypothetical protein